MVPVAIAAAGGRFSFSLEEARAPGGKYDATVTLRLSAPAAVTVALWTDHPYSKGQTLVYTLPIIPVCVGSPTSSAAFP